MNFELKIKDLKFKNFELMIVFTA